MFPRRPPADQMVVKDGNHDESQQCGGTDTKQQRNGQTLQYGVQDDNEGGRREEYGSRPDDSRLDDRLA